MVSHIKSVLYKIVQTPQGIIYSTDFFLLHQPCERQGEKWQEGEGHPVDGIFDKWWKNTEIASFQEDTYVLNSSLDVALFWPQPQPALASSFSPTSCVPRAMEAQKYAGPWALIFPSLVLGMEPGSCGHLINLKSSIKSKEDCGQCFRRTICRLHGEVHISFAIVHSQAMSVQLGIKTSLLWPQGPLSLPRGTLPVCDSASVCGGTTPC